MKKESNKTIRSKKSKASIEVGLPIDETKTLEVSARKKSKKSDTESIRKDLNTIDALVKSDMIQTSVKLDQVYEGIEYAKNEIAKKVARFKFISKDLNYVFVPLLITFVITTVFALLNLSINYAIASVLIGFVATKLGIFIDKFETDVEKLNAIITVLKGYDNK